MIDNNQLKYKSKDELISMLITCERKNSTLNHLYNIFDKYVITSTSDLKGRITEVSEAFCKISGYTKEELMGQPHNIVRHPDMPKSVFKELWSTIQKGEIWKGDVKNRTKDGSVYWVDSTIIPLKEPTTNKIYGYKSIRVNITDSKKLEDTLPDIFIKEEPILF
jgi:PAS domain S-box-containing protein